MQKVSVIISTKNSEKTIQHCLQSIQNQSYPQIEIVVVDNFSTDKTAQIARSVTKHLFSAGPERSAQRNIGVSKSSGRYVMIVDSDMYLSKNVIKECVSALKKDIVGIYIPEKILGDSFGAKVRNFERGFYNSTCIDAIRFLRKRDYIRVGGFDEDLNVAEDWDFDRRLRALGKTKEIQAHLFHDESGLDVRAYVAKKQRYFDGLEIYKKKWNNDSEVKKQIGFFYRMIWVFVEKNKWRRLFKHPVLSIAMLLLRTMIGLEYVVSRINTNK